MGTVMCRYCRKRFSKEKEKDWIMPSRNWYFHSECYPKHIEEIKNNTHNFTAQKTDEEYRKQIYSFLSEYLKVRYNGGVVARQIDAFVSQGMTMKGIYFSLVYYFEIERGVWTDKVVGIGIVKYIYEKSKLYWAERQSKEKDVLEKIEAQIQQRIARDTITVKRRKTNNKWKSHLDEIGEEDD